MSLGGNMTCSCILDPWGQLATCGQRGHVSFHWFWRGGYSFSCSFLSQKDISCLFTDSWLGDIYSVMHKFVEWYNSYFCHNSFLNFMTNIFDDRAFWPFCVTYCDIISVYKHKIICLLIKTIMLFNDNIHKTPVYFNYFMFYDYIIQVCIFRNFRHLSEFYLCFFISNTYLNETLYKGSQNPTLKINGIV